MSWYWPFSKKKIVEDPPPEPPCLRPGHKFEARYDELMPAQVPGEDIKDLAVLCKLPPHERVYVRDICTICGETVERRRPSSPPTVGKHDER